MDNKADYNAHIQDGIQNGIQDGTHDESNKPNLIPYEYELSEKDFYPPEDNRVLRSGVRDIVGGDNFADFTTDIFELYDEEEYFDNDL